MLKSVLKQADLLTVTVEKLIFFSPVYGGAFFPPVFTTPVFMILLKITPAIVAFFSVQLCCFLKKKKFLQLFQQRGVLSIVKSSNSPMVSRDGRVGGERKKRRWGKRWEWGTRYKREAGDGDGRKDGGWMNGGLRGERQCADEQHESESGPQLGWSWGSLLLSPTRDGEVSSGLLSCSLTARLHRLACSPSAAVTPRLSFLLGKLIDFSNDKSWCFTHIKKHRCCVSNVFCCAASRDLAGIRLNCWAFILSERL